MIANDAFRDFVHPQLNQEITAIGGYYVVTREVRLPFRRREVLCLIGYAVVDSSCCGAGGCAFARVAGFILNWKYKYNPDSRPLSYVEPIRDPAVRKEIQQLIGRQETVHQVNFD
ncbi:MAG: hypothetical protein JSW39_21920 [Desulfobacterales bacterium]|nr:MAG: hypothetical protein JSW39_21920 [Desulfobacterales bacterium]